MRWSEDHDLLLCREVLFIKLYQYKPGTKESGNAWNLVSEDLNSTQDLIFSTTQKYVHDRFRLLPRVSSLKRQNSITYYRI